MKHYTIEFEVPYIHAESEEDAIRKLLEFIEETNPKKLIRNVRTLEDQPLCPEKDEDCEAKWYGSGWGKPGRKV